ncbi:hypothetical protein L5515_005618 [Caenorhabditis briggsae]|uniref:BCAS3 WD40 domain-containing protein n=1 Tax=Caenorhabditis briggsae TaxID=6238 RepID=A0AAE9ENX5_CAEBR|nr:hypothetical protein L5515_005618 [Caenorhabditis briggsae]
MPPLPNNPSHGGGGSSKKKKQRQRQHQNQLIASRTNAAAAGPPEDVRPDGEDAEVDLSVRQPPPEEPKPQEKEEREPEESEKDDPEPNVEEEDVPVDFEKVPEEQLEDKKDLSEVPEEEKVERSEDVVPVAEDEVEKKKKEEVKETVAQTAEKDKKISGDLLDFSSSDDRSSLSSRPLVKDSPEEDDEEVVRTLNSTKRPASPPPSPPSSTTTSKRTVRASVDNMLVDMSLDDEKPAAPPRKTHQNSSQQRQQPPPIPSMNTIISKPRGAPVNYAKGQVVKQSAVEQQTFANQVIDLVAYGISSKTQSQSTQITAEKAEWVQLSTVEKAGEPNQRLEVLVIGLCRGYQIWTMSPSGDFEEVLSERQGPVRALKILPNNIKLRGKTDPFADARPLIAVVDASSHHPDRQYCSVTIISLLTGKEVHKIKFEEPVVSVNASDQFLVVSLCNNAVVYSIIDFKPVRKILTAPPCDHNPPSLALSCQLLAYADKTLDSSIQSSGGLAAEVEPATTEKYTDQLYSAVSFFTKGVKTISDSMTGGGSGSTTKTNQPQGIITVLNLAHNPEDDSSDGVMCHYVAHVDPISYISFSPDQRLVLSADANANVFNIFLLMPHPTTSSLASVQHLYKLNRGNTTAKIISTAFSEDCRWLGITSNHGTTHLFAICPFGGKPNQRTHGDTFVNKESRFHRSAGLTDAADVVALIGPSRHRAMTDSCNYTKDHPIAVNSPVLAKTNGNTRVGPFPPPLLLTATEKIKDSKYTKEDLQAWATDLASFSYLGNTAATSLALTARKRLEVNRMSVVFRMRSSNSTTSTKTAKTTKLLTSMSIIIAKVDPSNGVMVIQQDIKPVRKEGEVTTNNHEAPPQITITPVGGWQLQRTKNNTDMHAPMPPNSPIMAFATVETEESRREGEEMWTPHVETRTYSHPPRWLCQGPQFTLYVYQEDDQPSLMSPGNKGSNASFKSIPVMVGSEAMNITKKTIPADATRIECGSYQSNSYSLNPGDDQTIGGYNVSVNGDFTGLLADAMRDLSGEEEALMKKKSPRNDDDEFFDTESSAPFARNGSTNGTSNGKSTKKKKAPPTSAPMPATPSRPATTSSKTVSPPDDFGTFDMDDLYEN